MQKLIIQAGDMGPMSIKYPATTESPGQPPADEEAIISAFEDCLSLIRRENTAIVIFRLIYTAEAVHKVELYYSLRGRMEISPMGIKIYTYSSLTQFRERMHADFSKLEFPL